MSLGFASNSSVRQAGRGATLGTATSSFVGVVRVDATTMIVDANGTISVDPSALNNLSSVTATNIATLSSNLFTLTTTGAKAITNSGGWSVTPSSNTIYFNYNGTNVAKLDSSGNLTVKASITAFGTV